MMKIVLREWLKDKKACTMMLMHFFMDVAYIAINALILVLVSEALSDPKNILGRMDIIALLCVIQMIGSSVSQAIRKSAIFHCFSTLNNQYGDKILDADVEMFTKFSCATVYTTCEFLWNITAVGQQLVGFVLNLINIIITLYSMYKIGGNLVIPVILIYLVGTLVMKYQYGGFTDIDKELARCKRARNQEMENIINGFAEVRSFGMTDWHKYNLHQMNDVVYKCGKKRTKMYAMVNFVIEATDTLGLLGVMWYVSRQIIAGLMTQAQAMSLVMFVFRLISPLLNMLDFIDDLSQNLSLSKDYEKILSYVNTCYNSGDIELKSFNSNIELKDVSFSYNTSEDVIDKISMNIKKGSKIGICGTSGAGKSTLFKLFNKFYMPTSGNITIDGINVWDISDISYHKFIGSVHQENIIFPGSIRANIEYGSNGIKYTEEEFIDACKKANLYEFVMKLPERFNTEVGPRGLKLSGGQRQRIALARLFLRDPEIILLDEATSALDNENEFLIQDAIDKLGDKTVITIAHRLSTIRNCDRIYVIGDHKILENGSHDELMKLNGKYAEMIEAGKTKLDRVAI